MRATLVLFALLCAVYSEAVPLQVYRPDESSVSGSLPVASVLVSTLKVFQAVDVVVLENSPELYDSEDEDEWKQEEEFTEGAMGKRSIALGRSGFRPGKRSMDNFHTVDVR